MAYDNQCGSCANFYESKGNNLYDKTNAYYVKGYCTWYGTYYYPNDTCDSHFKNRDSGSSEGCYITTILCNRLGFDDHCDELNILREFRNSVLQKNEKYKDLLFEYDTVGPEIAQFLLEEDITIIEKLYESFLKPIIQFVKEKCEDIAISKYNQMMKGLEEYYGVEPKETPHEYSYQQGGHGFIKYKEKRI